MHKTLRNFVVQHQFAFAFAIFLAWQASAWFPLTPFEGDAISVALGCEQTYAEGLKTLGNYGYGYWMQPLTYIILVGLKVVLPAVSAVTTYTIIALVSVIALQWLMAKLCIALTGCKPWLPFLAMLLLPETYALGTFPNATAPALCLATGAFYAIIRGKRLLPCVLLLIAPLLRLDIVQIYPAYPLFLYWQSRNLKYTAINTILLAVAVIAVLAVVYPLLGASVLHTYNEYNRWGATLLTFQKNLNALYGCFGAVSLPLVLLGVITLLCRKEYILACIVLIPSLIIICVNHSFGNAAKHFCQTMPVLIPALTVALAQLILLRRKLLVTTTLVLCGLYMIIGLQICGTSQNLLSIHGPSLEIWRGDIHGRPIKLVLGIGTPSTTADEVALLSGNLYYPMTIHNIKLDQERRLDKIEQTLLGAPDDAILLYIDSDENAILMALMEQQGRTHGRTVRPSPDLISLQSAPETSAYYDHLSQLVRKRYGENLPRVHILTLSAIHHRNLALQHAILERLGANRSEKINNR